MEVQIEKLSSGDINKFQEVIEVFEDVFEMENFVMPEKSYLQQLLERDDFFVCAAVINSRVVGGLTSYLLRQYYSLLPLIYIYDLGVLSQFQRQGIGRQLITATLSYGKEIGAEEVFVQADEDDDIAQLFYKSTGGIAQKATHFCYPLNTDKPVK